MIQPDSHPVNGWSLSQERMIPLAGTDEPVTGGSSRYIVDQRPAETLLWSASLRHHRVFAARLSVLADLGPIRSCNGSRCKDPPGRAVFSLGVQCCQDLAGDISLPAPETTIEVFTFVKHYRFKLFFLKKKWQASCYFTLPVWKEYEEISIRLQVR